MRLTLLLAFVAFAGASAQSVPVGAPVAGPPVNAWISLGLGGGSLGNESGLSTDGELTLSSGRFLIAGRFTQMMPTATYVDVPGPGRNELGNLTSESLLIGARSTGSALFATGAVGVGRATRDSRAFVCPSCLYLGPGASDGADLAHLGLALEGGLHASIWHVGLGARLFTLAGAGKAQHTTLSLSVDAGWFGR